MNLKKFIIFIILVSFYSIGCAQIPVSDRTIEKMNRLSSTFSKINLSAKTINIGMSKEQVLVAWGKADWYDWYNDSPDGVWYYSNVNDSSIKNPITYSIYFKDKKVEVITESIWSEKKLRVKTIDL